MILARHPGRTRPPHPPHMSWASIARSSRPAGRSVAVAAAMCAVVFAAAGCGRDDDGAARELYNQALSDLKGSNWDESIAGFVDARNSAGPDEELRFRAAFNLGLSYARKADQLASAGAAPELGGAASGENPLEQAIEMLSHSAAWYRDASRMRPDDEEARQALEVVLRRAQVLADQLNKGQNKLEARLASVIEDQRALRDKIRTLMSQVAASRASSLFCPLLS
ncbi:MAG: hypothetical protein AAGC55_11110 [Myxococcota bacterium]